MDQTIVELLNRFGPEPDVLLREISGHIDDAILDWISRADYGSRADEHMVALRQVRDTGRFPDNLTWCPMEVLELTRWSEPEETQEAARTTFEHWARAFSCAAILRAEHEPYNYLYNNGCTCSTVIQLIWSLRLLPMDFRSQAASHLAWLILHSDPEGRNDQVRVYGVEPPLVCTSDRSCGSGCNPHIACKMDCPACRRTRLETHCGRLVRSKGAGTQLPERSCLGTPGMRTQQSRFDRALV